MAHTPGPPQDVVNAIQRSRRPLIIGHVRPDGDCLGAILALAATLERDDGCEPRAFYREDQISQRLAFLCELAGRPVSPPPQRRECDGVVVLDTAHISRAASDPPLAELAASGLPIINIDHHVDNPGFGAVNWVVPEASSTCELVYRLLVATGSAISSRVASLLYSGLHTDTAGFSLPNTTADSLQVGAALIAAGADVADLCERLCRSQARSEFDLARLIYANTRLTPDGQIAYSTAAYDEIAGTGCTAADIDEQVNIPRSLKGIRMAILFTEGKRGRVRLNLRGEGGTSVLALARGLGGGGHEAAAGAIVDGPMDRVVSDVLERATQALGAQG